MHDARSTGRWLGAFTLTQMIAAFILNAVLLGPVITPPGFLVNAAAEPWRITWVILLNLVASASLLAGATVAWPSFKTVNTTLARWYVAITTVGLTVATVENVGLFSMQKVSNAYATAVAGGLADASTWEGIRVLTANIRNGAHYSNVFLAGSGIFVLYLLLFRGKLVPRPLAVFGMLAALSQMIAVGAPFFWQPAIVSMLMPLALSHLVLAVWLLAKGFAQPAAS